MVYFNKTGWYFGYFLWPETINPTAFSTINIFYSYQKGIRELTAVWPCEGVSPAQWRIQALCERHTSVRSQSPLSTRQVTTIIARKTVECWAWYFARCVECYSLLLNRLIFCSYIITDCSTYLTNKYPLFAKIWRTFSCHWAVRC